MEILEYFEQYLFKDNLQVSWKILCYNVLINVFDTSPNEQFFIRLLMKIQQEYFIITYICM